MKLPFLLFAALCAGATLPDLTAAPRALEAGVRGLATRAPAKMVIDGDLSEFKDAFCTPVEYFHADLTNRAAQFWYMWDETAFYAGLRTLDTKPANMAPDHQLWEGDAVEWYFDTRPGDQFRSPKWGPGAVHCYWTGLTGTNIQSRFCLRPGYLDAIPKIGVEVASRRTGRGMEVEFKLPWANFPNFKPIEGAVIGLDAELCYSDGAGRVFRSFVYGSPLSVQQPANLAKVQLVRRLEREDWAQVGPVMAPMRCDTAWGQPTRPQVTGYMAVPPLAGGLLSKVSFHLQDLKGGTLGEYPATVETFEPEGGFQRAVAHWPVDAAPPGGHFVLAIAYDGAGKELTRVTSRLVSVNMTPGY